MATRSRLTIREHDATSGQVTKSYILSTTTNPNSNHNWPNASVTRIDQIPTSLSSQASISSPDTSTHPVQRTSIFFANSYLTALLSYLSALFLPLGYPHTVTPDYKPYQIYDSIQAFASTIAGLLSSRAVLQSLNVISPTSITSDTSKDVKVKVNSASTGTIPPSSTEAATFATLLSILQSTLANGTSILFASHVSSRISPDVKYYRFLADITNDLAFILDLLAPSLPGTFAELFGLLNRMPWFDRVVKEAVVTVTLREWTKRSLLFLGMSAQGLAGLLPALLLTRFSMPTIPPRVVALCVSCMLRAMCGVTGGSSKAVLSSHFARHNPDHIGDLNAKDGSQETVVNLFGMWVGGFVVSRVSGTRETWVWMLGLLAMHLWANWMAVRSVRLRALNRGRMGVVTERLWLEKGRREGVDLYGCGIDEVNRSEGILGLSRSNYFYRSLNKMRRNERGRNWGNWRVGVSAEEFVSAVYGLERGLRKNRIVASDSFTLAGEGDRLLRLFNLFKDERYLLWVNPVSYRITIALKKDSEAVTQLRAWCHGLLVVKGLNNRQAFMTKGRKDGGQELTMHGVIAGTSEELKEMWKALIQGLEKLGWDLGATNLEDGRGVRIDVDSQ